MQVTPLAQRDQRWSNQLLGRSRSTIGGEGCAVTCLAMYLNAVDPISCHTPLSINDQLLKGNGYRLQNLVDWQKLPKIFPKLQYLGRTDCPNTKAPIDRIKEHLQRVPAEPLIVYVNYNAPNWRTQKQHFVLIAGALETETYTVADPWLGDFQGLTPRYGKNDLQAICGIIWLHGLYR